MSHSTARRIRRAAERQGARRKNRHRDRQAPYYTKKHTKLRRTY